MVHCSSIEPGLWADHNGGHRVGWCHIGAVIAGDVRVELHGARGTVDQTDAAVRADGRDVSLLTVLSGRNGTLVIRFLSWPPWKMKIPPARVGSTTVRVSRTADTLVVGMPP